MVYEDIKIISKIVRKVVGKTDQNQSLSQLDVTLNDLETEEDSVPFDMKQLTDLITIDDKTVTQEKYK
jgi:hypothetical protein